jgi:4a-hydroxytetrahydrobiopterin dehydratase
MELLTEAQLAGELTAVPAWSRRGDELSVQVTRTDFGDALRYVNAVGYLAERAGHHPDIAIAWNKVTLTLSTHSAGGLTAADFALARQIDALLLSRSPPGAVIPRSLYAPRSPLSCRLPSSLCRCAPSLLSPDDSGALWLAGGGGGWA